MATSSLRLHYREVIAEILAGLPADADRKACKRALRGLVPQSPSHPHQMYLKEVKFALDQRFGPQEAAAEPTPQVTATPFGVTCGWCDSKGCISCAQIRHERERAIAGGLDLDQWQRFLFAAQSDPVARLALADWLMDYNWPEQAARVLAEINPMEER